MRKALMLLMTLASLVGVSRVLAADAGDKGFYVLGGVGKATEVRWKPALDDLLDFTGGGAFSSTYGKPSVYMVDVGYQLNRYFAIEGGYVSSSHETYSATGGNLAAPLTASAGANGWKLSGVITESIGKKFSFLAKMGIADFTISGSISGPNGVASASNSKSDVTYGAGLKYDFTNVLFGRLDVDRYTVGSSSAHGPMTVWMLDLGYKF
jgi:opacity protein-like surface antigen